MTPVNVCLSAASIRAAAAIPIASIFVIGFPFSLDIEQRQDGETRGCILHESDRHGLSFVRLVQGVGGPVSELAILMRSKPIESSYQSRMRARQPRLFQRERDEARRIAVASRRDRRFGMRFPCPERF